MAHTHTKDSHGEDKFSCNLCGEKEIKPAVSFGESPDHPKGKTHWCGPCVKKIRGGGKSGEEK